MFSYEYLYEYIRKAIGGQASPGLDSHTIAAAAIGILIVCWIGSLVYRITPNFRKYDPDEYDAKWRGIKWTLIPVAALVAFEPLRVLGEIYVGRLLYQHVTWLTFATEGSPRYHPGFSALLTANAFLKGAQFAFAGLLLLVFVRRRRIFRLVMIGYLLYIPLMFAVLDMFLSAVFGRLDMIVFENSNHIFAGLRLAVVGIPWVLLSRRVNATFRE